MTLNYESPIGSLKKPNILFIMGDNLRADPVERATDSPWYADWKAHRAFLLVPAQAIVGRYLESFKEFPPRAKAASFTVSDAMEKIEAAATGRSTAPPVAKAA